MSKPEGKEAAARRLKHERADMHEAILAVTFGWSTLEDRLALLLSQMITPKGWGPGPAIYFAPENAATRFAIVDVVARFHFIMADDKDPQRDAIHGIYDEWSTYFNSLGRARSTRNAIVHGSVRLVEIGRSGREVVRLAPSTWDVDRHFSLKPGQIPGLSPIDVERAAKKLKAPASRARIFTKAAERCHLERTALPRSLAELTIDRRHSASLLQDDQKPAEYSSLPPASEK